MPTTRVYLSPPDVSELEADKVREAVLSGWLAPTGPALDEFEDALASLASRRFAVAVSSGTAALHLGLLSLGVRQGDVVICSTLTFVATANAIKYVGAVPVFVDSMIESGNMNPALLERALLSLQREGRRVSAVIPVDFLGKIADYDEILPICSRFGVPVLADAAESVGALLNGRPAGSWGDSAVFSFNGNKIMTTSGGGVLLTNNHEQSLFARKLATQARENFVHYEHRMLGYNYRLSNVLASLGLAQLERLPTFLLARKRLRQRYVELFENVAGVLVFGGIPEGDNCWLTSILIDPVLSGFTREALATHLENYDIESRPIWNPMHLQPLYSGEEAFVDGTAEMLFRDGLILPSGSATSEEDWQRIETAISLFVSNSRTS